MNLNTVYNVFEDNLSLFLHLLHCSKLQFRGKYFSGTLNFILSLVRLDFTSSAKCLERCT